VSIYKDQSGRWHGYVSMGLTDHGRRDRRHVSGRRRDDVLQKVRELERRRDEGAGFLTGRQVTVASWLEHWLDTIAAQKVRPSTLQRYRQLVAHQLVPKIGHHRLDRLQPEHVERMYAELLASGLAPASVLQAHRVLSRALTVAMQRGRIPRNVCRLVDAPRVQRSEVQPLTPEEARRVLRTAEDRRNGARWAVALALGLRQGEALGLRWDACDLETRTLRIRRALQRQPGSGLVMVDPKSAAGRRTITLPPQLADVLRQHRARQLQERIAAANVWEDHGLVFCQPNGRPIDPRSDHRAWRSLLVDAGVRPARLHDARHTAATVMLTLGVPARVAMQILGHSQISLTLGTYSHVVPELAEDAAVRVGDALWGQVATTAAPQTTLGVPSDEETPRSEGVRREGLEPPTRGLRVRCSAS
jgi:integrase